MLSSRLCLGVLLLLPAVVHASEPVTLSGHVIAVNNGQGVAQSAVTLTFATDSGGPTAITVFSDEQGAFRMPLHVSAIPADASLEAHKLGYRQVNPAGGAVQLKSSAPSGSFETRLYRGPGRGHRSAGAGVGVARASSAGGCEEHHADELLELSPVAQPENARVRREDRSGARRPGRRSQGDRGVAQGGAARIVAHDREVHALAPLLGVPAGEHHESRRGRLADRAERRLQLLQRAAGRDRRELPGRALSALDRLPAERCLRLRRTARREPENRDPRVRISGRRAGARARAGAALAVSLGRGCAAQSARAPGPARRCDQVDRSRLQGLDRPAHDRARRRRQPVGHDGRQRSVRPLRPEEPSAGGCGRCGRRACPTRSRWPAQRSCTTCPSTRAGTWRATHQETSG